jgi:endonuclease/exonuclease/phosphatase family metal-dependent hydrolase
LNTFLAVPIPSAMSAELEHPRRRRETLRRERTHHKARKQALQASVPYLAVVRSPRHPRAGREMGADFTVATYNVHRWSGMNGASTPDAARAGFVISELGADVIALQEVLRPFEGDDPLERIADALHLHVAFATARVHRLGELGNAILSRWPITSVFTLDLTFSNVEKRSAVAAQFTTERGPVAIVATHLALVDRTRQQQVEQLLGHPRLQGPVVLLGDMNAWRRCKATKALDAELGGGAAFPRTFPAASPLLALDRIYARGADVSGIAAHKTAAAKRASDHLPVVARVKLARE